MDYENHPFAEVWPSLVGDEFDKLLADIRENGQRLPIILHSSKILDGRNRYRACRTLNIEPKFETYSGTEEQAKALVRSLNEHRRHLTPVQKRVSVKQLQDAHPDMSARQIGDRLKVSHNTVTAVKQEMAIGQIDQLPKPKKVTTRSGGTYTVISAEEREKRNAAILEYRQMGYTVARISRTMKLPERTIRDAMTRTASKPRKARSATPPVPVKNRSLNTVLPLTREQVDPEFTGSAIEWVDKYGHVQMETAEKRATGRFTDWAIVMGYLAKKFKSQPTLPDVDLGWLRSPRQADIDRMRAALEVLKPLIDKADAMLKQAAGP